MLSSIRTRGFEIALLKQLQERPDNFRLALGLEPFNQS